MQDGTLSRSGARSSRDDAALIRRCQRGDVEAMNELIQAYQKHVFNLAFRLSGNYDDAQDIAQEAFIRVFNSINSFRGEANFSTWIYRIVTNVFLDERKKQRVRDHGSLDEYLELEDSSVARQIEDPSPGPEASVEQRERNEVVGQAVLALPENQRVMIALYHFQGRSYEEIADVMQLPIGTVKSRLNRARLALKEKLGAARELLGA
jgi:RNA polymerase sigma-70 factor (ECF subfamily)